MSQIYGDPTPANGRAADGTQVAASMDRQGVLSVSDRVREAAMAGKLFVAQYGTVTTPLVTPVTAAIVAARPQAWLRVPTGKAIYVVRHTIVVEANGITTQGEIAIAITSNDVGDGIGADGTKIQNAVPGLVGTTPSVTSRQLATGDVTAEEDYVELDRFGFAASAVNQKFEFNANENGLLIPIYGSDGASFLTYIGGNAVNFYAQTVFIEENTNLAS